jgi:acyl transferase domain-containing protein/acyl carrier protein
MAEIEAGYNETGLEIAVIGMAGQFPGAKDINEFWERLKNGIESISFFSDKELEEAGIEPGLLKNPDYVKARPVLEEMEYFDAAFFGYTPKEAELMDPQVRIFHEYAWAALEDAAYVSGSFNKLIGCYAGAASNFYWEVLAFISGKKDTLGQFEARQLFDKDLLCTRVAHKLNLRGPAVSLHSTCSTSLVAIHMACQGLISGECDMALAGGVAILHSKKTGHLYQEGMILSPDGHCKTFDAQANGTIFGDGVGVVVLKRLEEAVTDRDHIYAVIKGSFVNNDGIKKAAYTAPSVEGQAAVIRTAHQAAEVDPETVTYIETHGTGTSLGDPVEIEGLKLAFNTHKKHFCKLGSIKTNMGHLNTAAGVAGFIKTVLALNHKQIPPTLHFKAPNPKIDFENSPFMINERLNEWKGNGKPLRAGVSAFGIGGTNAHVILEEFSEGTRGLAPLTDEEVLCQGKGGVSPPSQSRQYQLILLSAKTQSSLEQMTRNLVEHFKKNPGINLADAAYTLMVGRDTFQYGKMVVCSTGNEVIETLSSADSTKVKTSQVKSEENSVIFMFPGLGSQYTNMGWELYQTESLFRREMDRCFEILNGLLDYDIKEILYPDNLVSEVSGAGSYGSAQTPDTGNSPLERGTPDPRKGEGVFNINQTEIAQMVIFIFEYALAKLLMKWGITPDAMIGYSFGEYTAACLSGVFSLEDALKLIVSRGKLIKKIPAGAMLSVPLPQKDLIPLLSEELSIAIDNGPSCIVAGTDEVANAFEKQMKKKRLLCMRVQVSHAIHSPMMEPIRLEYEKFVNQVQLNKPLIPYISNVTGEWSTVKDATDPAYWSGHLQKPVKFADGINHLVKKKNAIFIEIGPGRDLTTALARHIQDKPGIKATHLVRHQEQHVSDMYFLLNKIGRLWLWGVKIQGEEFYAPGKRYRIPLPTYPFERQFYWLNTKPFEIDAIGAVGGTYAKKEAENSPTPGKQDIAEWFYLPSWKRIMKPSHPPTDKWAPCCWLLFMDDCGIGARLAETLRQRGQRIITVKMGNAFQKESHDEFTLNPEKGCESDYRALFAELDQHEKRPDKIVHLWNVTHIHPNHKELTPEEVKKAQDLGYYSLLNIAQALGAKDYNQNLELTVVTNNMAEVNGNDGLCPGKATVLGPVKVMPQEYSHTRCRCIDIDLTQPGSYGEETLPDRLLEELTGEWFEPIVALRGFYRWTPTFEPLRLEKAGKRSPIIKEGGVYLVTGGLGGIGLLLAQYLAETVRAKLVLSGRSPFPSKDKWDQWLASKHDNDPVSRKIRKVKELEKSGAEILISSADVTDEQQMAEVVNRSLKVFGRLDGVLHCAGLPDGEMIQRRTRETSQRVLAPKIKGTLVLDKILQTLEPDFFIICSSISSLLPGLGQVGYCAANNFVDAFASVNISRGCVTMSINWDRWQNVGIAVIAETVHKGLTGENLQEGMTAQQGIDAFHRLLASPFRQIIVSTRDIIEIPQPPGTFKPSAVMERIEHIPIPGKVIQRPELDTEYVAPRDESEEILAGIWAAFFGFERIGIRDDFFELGGDSLKAMIVATKIHKKLDVEVSIQEFFNRPTIEMLARYIRHHAQKNTYASIEPGENKEYYELSSAQKRLYVLQQIAKQSTNYNEPFVRLVEGNLVIKRFQDTFKQLTRRHEIFRTAFEMIRGKPIQRIYKDIDFEIEYHQADREAGNQENPTETADRVIKNFIRPFDLTRAPLFRVGLVKLEEANHVLIVDIHHIISDIASFTILIEEFMALYSGGRLQPLKIQYKDYSAWQNTENRKQALKDQEEYWLKEFAGEIPILNLPLDYPRPKQQSYKGSRMEFVIEEKETLPLREMASQQEVTLFMILLAVFNILLAKLSGQKDIVVGTSVEGRRHEDLRSVIGMFVNTLPLKNYPAEKKSFKEFLTQVKQRTLEAFDNQDHPFEDLVDQLKINRQINRNPLFDVLFQLDRMDIPGIETADLRFLPHKYEIDVSKFDIRLRAFESEKLLVLRFEYFTALFKTQTIKRFIGYFKEILSQVIKNNDIRLKEINISHDLFDGKSNFKAEDYSGFGF